MSATSIEHTSMLEALRPPEGWFVAAAFGTTFSLELDALVAALLALAGEDGECADRRIQLAAILRLRGLVRVFVNQGSIKAPGKANSLHPILERVISVKALTKASFHPKVWVLKLMPRGATGRHAAARYRLICASRNLTMARTWELAIQLEGEQHARQHPSPAASALADFMLTVIRGAGHVPPEIKQMAEDVRMIRFAPGRETREDLDFVWQWPGKARGASPLAELLPRNATRVLVISPFLNPAFLKRLKRLARDVLVVSTRGQLDALPKALTDELKGKGFCFKTVSGTRESGVPGTLDLHAKLFVIETRDATKTILGSANATRAGFGLARDQQDVTDWEASRRNAEAVVVLRPGLKRSELDKGFLAGATVRRWEEPSGRDEKKLIARRRLERIRDMLLAIGLSACWTPAAESLSIQFHSALPVELADPKLRCMVRPAQLHCRQRLKEPSLKFPYVRADEVSGLIAFELRDTAVGEKVEWTQLAELPPDDSREREIVRTVVARNSRLALIARLLGKDVGAVGGLAPPKDDDPEYVEPQSPRGKPKARTKGRGSEVAFSLEELLEACTAEPGLVHEVDALLTGLDKAKESGGRAAGKEDKRLADFIKFWRETFKPAWDKVEAPHG